MNTVTRVFLVVRERCPLRSWPDGDRVRPVMGQDVSSFTSGIESASALRLVTRQPLFQLRAQQSCWACGHQLGEHVGFPDAALAKQPKARYRRT